MPIELTTQEKEEHAQRYLKSCLEELEKTADNFVQMYKATFGKEVKFTIDIIHPE